MSWIRGLRARQRLDGAEPWCLVDMSPAVHEQRLRKSPAELAIMRKAATISAGAHRRAMAYCRPGLFEYELAAELQHAFLAEGASGPAYSSIVGGGSNACVLHYTDNASVLAAGDLVLIDAGCEFAGYAADITRTFPVSGRFSAAQRAVYDVVLDAQRAALAVIAPGRHFDEPQQAAVRSVTRGLKRLGILQGRLAALIKADACRPFFMHRYGHWLGMDVHDVGAYQLDGRWRRFEPGMVLTVEPGLYIASDNTDVAACWRGIGVRIEDDVLVTEHGVEILTDGVPREADAIEALMREAIP